MDRVTRTFAQFNFPASISQNLRQIGYETPTPVQFEVLDLPPTPSDLIVLGTAGTGKTAAYALKLLRDVLDPSSPVVQAMILVPSIDLASQVAGEFRRLSEGTGLRVLYLAGDRLSPSKIAQLKHETYHLIVGTPGRVAAMCREHHIDCSQCRVRVTDEFDEMFMGGFSGQIDEIGAYLAPNCVSLVFSGTLSPRAEEVLASRFGQTPRIDTRSTDPEIELRHEFFRIRRETARLGALTELLIRSETRTLVFGEERFNVEIIDDHLRSLGMRVAAITNKTSDSARAIHGKQFRTGKLDVIVATDLMGRGSDFPGELNVINYKLPTSAPPTTLLQRIRRTGRLQTTGRAWTIVTRDEIVQAVRIRKEMGIKSPFVPKGRGDFARPHAIDQGAVRDRSKVAQIVEDTLDGYRPLRSELFIAALGGESAVDCPSVRPVALRFLGAIALENALVDLWARDGSLGTVEETKTRVRKFTRPKSLAEFSLNLRMARLLLVDDLGLSADHVLNQFLGPTYAFLGACLIDTNSMGIVRSVVAPAANLVEAERVYDEIPRMPTDLGADRRLQIEADLRYSFANTALLDAALYDPTPASPEFSASRALAVQGYFVFRTAVANRLRYDDRFSPPVDMKGDDLIRHDRALQRQLVDEVDQLASSFLTDDSAYRLIAAVYRDGGFAAAAGCAERLLPIDRSNSSGSQPSTLDPASLAQVG